MSRVKITLIEIVVVLAMLAVLFLVALPMLERSREARRRGSCQGNLHRIAMAFSMYEKESRGGLWPSLRRCAGSDCSDNVAVDQLWVPDMPVLYPEYLPDVSLFVCPSDSEDPLARGMWSADRQPGGEVVPCQVGEASYTYLAWMIRPDEYLRDPGTMNTHEPLDGLLAPGFVDAMTEAVQRMAVACQDSDFAVFDEDITVGDKTIYRPRNGIESIFLEGPRDQWSSYIARSELPVLYDNIDLSVFGPLMANGLPSNEILMLNHMPGGSNVLYMDGHVQFSRYSRDWPICSTWIRTLAMLKAVE